jgi:nitroreductase
MSRSFDGGPSLDQILDWCRTALRAPTAGFSQGSHLVVLHEESLRRFWQDSGAGKWFSTASPGVLTAPYVVLVGGRRSAYTDRYSSPDKSGHGLEDEAGWSTPFWLTDAAMAAQNLLLLVEEARGGALFFGVFRNRSAVASSLGLPDDFEIVGAVAIGTRAEGEHPSGSPTRRPRIPDDDLVHVGRW